MPPAKKKAATPLDQETASEKDKAWTAAARRLRETHKTDWETFLREEYHHRGLTWNPRPTKEQRDRDQLALLIAAYPEDARALLPPEADSDAAG